MPQALSLGDNKYHVIANFPDADLVCAFSSRISGNMSLFYANAHDALANRKDFLKRLNIDYRNLVCAKQVHGSVARYICEADMGKGAISYEDSVPDTDALLTDNKNLPLSIFTADCLSIFLYDVKNHAVALIHAGWRSSREHIAGKTIKLMQGTFNSRARDLYAAFGPAIRDCCYEVGEEFTESFTAGYLVKRNGHYYLDLAGMNKRQLLDSGVKDKNIFDPKICTFCRSEKFFSYRKEGAGCGRMISVMMLK